MRAMRAISPLHRGAGLRGGIASVGRIDGFNIGEEPTPFSGRYFT